jgi:hypothetical protein
VTGLEGYEPCAHELGDKLKAVIAQRLLRKFSHMTFLRLKKLLNPFDGDVIIQA